jgi:hypothetical protein
MPLCLTAGTVSVVLVANAFTLAWTHSIEKIRWEEDWQVVGERLQVVAARIRGSGAGHSGARDPAADPLAFRG